LTAFQEDSALAAHYACETVKQLRVAKARYYPARNSPHLYPVDLVWMTIQEHVYQADTHSIDELK